MDDENGIPKFVDCLDYDLTVNQGNRSGANNCVYVLNTDFVVYAYEHMCLCIFKFSTLQAIDVLFIVDLFLLLLM